jgi:iron complex transport system ATP-binding protein
MTLPDLQLSIDSLSVFLGGKEILKPSLMSFRAQSKEIIGLLGPNGSGKSTLLRAVCGLVKRNSGSVAFSGKDVSSAKPKELAKIFAHVAQSERFSAAYTVLESVVMGRYPHLRSFENYGGKDYDIARDSIRRVSLSGFENRIVTELSGGESARVVIARALVQDTPVLLLDEPTAALDPKHALEIMRLARELADEGKIILTAIHDVNLAMEVTDRLIFLKDGKIAADRNTDEIDSDILGDVYDVQWEILTADSGRRFAFPSRCGKYSPEIGQPAKTRIFLR